MGPPSSTRGVPPASRRDIASISSAHALLPDGTVQPYPKAPTTHKVERVRGVRVRDPYRPLEHMHAAPTRTWVTAQKRLTKSYMSRIPAHEEFTQALKATYVSTRSLYAVVGSRLFYAKGVGKELALICSSDLNGRHERVLLDPNTLSKDAHIAVDEWTVSPNGRMLAYAVRRNGSDELEWRVRDISKGEDLPDRIHGGRYGTDTLTWSGDSKGFLYTRYRTPQSGRELTAVVRFDSANYHRVGTPQSQDLPYGSPDVPTFEDGSKTDMRGNKFTPLGDPIKGFTYYRVHGPDYPRGAVTAIHPERPHDVREVVPQRKETLEDVSFVHGEFFATYLRDAHSHVLAFDVHGKPLGEVKLPGMGTVGRFHEAPHGRVVFQYSTPTRPNTIYSYDMRTHKAHALWEPKTTFDPNNYETKLVLCPSKDGRARIPLYITHRKDVPLDGRRPTYLYAYGGFGANETPEFDWKNIPWLDKGGVYVHAALRGGGENGEEWHRDGMRMRKQNVFDDFIAAGEYLVKSGVTSPAHLAIGGGSNGGLLVAATELQRPDLFGAAVPEVGVMDMVRFPLFTGGNQWIKEYGEVSKPRLLKNLLSYSPVHNIQAGRAYPATLVITGDHDDRVVPAHSYKFTAAMQQAQGSNAPVLLRVNHNMGHGFGKPLSMRIAEAADRWAFLWHHIGA